MAIFNKLTMIIFALLFLTALYFIPYEEIRVERIRAFGENKTVGIITDKQIVKSPVNNRATYTVTYQYTVPDGMHYKKTAPIPCTKYKSLNIGDATVTIYAVANPTISRLTDQIDSNFVKIISIFSRKK